MSQPARNGRAAAKPGAFAHMAKALCTPPRPRSVELTERTSRAAHHHPLVALIRQQGPIDTTRLCDLGGVDSRQVWGRLKLARERGLVRRINKLWVAQPVQRPVNITWLEADAQLPDDETTVLCWLHASDEWCSGWHEAGAWLDAASGGELLGVTHWAHVQGPTP